jgi:hypothetical protein
MFNVQSLQNDQAWMMVINYTYSHSSCNVTKYVEGVRHNLLSRNHNVVLKPQPLSYYHHQSWSQRKEACCPFVHF